jgi:sugar phosphate isomerase/epimerase
MQKGLSRRQFLHRSSIMGLAVMGRAFRASAWAATESRPAGVQLYMVNDELTKDPAGTFKQIAIIGYKEVESAGFANLSAAEFRKRVEEAGLSCPSAHLRFGIEDTGRLLEDANTLGAKYAVSSVLPPRRPETNDLQGFLNVMNHLSLDDFKRMAEMANQIGEQARKAGLQYAYHNHNVEFRNYDGQTGYSVLMKETDPSLVKFEVDCGWMINGGGDPVEYFQRYPHRFPLVHLKDFTATTTKSTALAPGTEHQAPTELGHGQINFQPILEEAKKIGMQHCFVDQDPPFHGMTALEAARVDYQYVHRLL